MGFNCLKAAEPLRGDSLLFTHESPKKPGTHLIYVDICKAIVPKKLNYCLSNLANVRIIRRGIMYFMIEFRKVKKWLQFACSEEWTRDSITKFDWVAKIRFIQKQPPEVFCKKRCSQKFCKIHMETPVPK